VSGNEVPPGLYDTLITRGLERELAGVSPELVDATAADPGEVDTPLARHVARLVARTIADIREPDRVQRGVELANAIVALCQEAAGADHEVAAGARQLREVRAGHLAPPRPRPSVPLSANAILVNGRGEPRIGHELSREIGSADRVDLIVAFLFWRGVRLIERDLADLVARGGHVRVLTTTYAAATEQRAIDALVGLGAEVKVSYDIGATRLHAKAWLFERATGLTTAYVGSSNLSRSAQIDGLEWNVRLAEAESPGLVRRFRTVFESYWASEQFEPYDPTTFATAIRSTKSPALADEVVALDVHPYPHQRRILEDLDVERKRHNRWRNFVVAATGTGKTVVAAFDYRRLRDDLAIDGRRDASLLFIAHRREILHQSLTTFRQVLRRGDFGELFVDGVRPDQWRHVFASIQSLANVDLERVPNDHFDVVIVDEFHHAEAPTYQRLLEHVKPRVLLGLTATPERADGRSVLRWFDDRIASELRLWDAVEGGMLSPFQYFGLHDDVDLEGLEWRRGGYDIGALDRVYTGNDARAAKVVAEVCRLVADPGRMRALGFCVSVAHAHFMARYFSERGLAARALDATTAPDVRRAALADLESGDIHALFAVDLLNEGVDLPHVDTVLFLRPTESATVFLQQLGRGLRRADDKPCLTVIDFIGNQNRRFRFDRRYRALTGASRAEIEQFARDGFPFLPSGCHIELDRIASKIVLDNIRQQLRVPRRELVDEARRTGDRPLATFLGQTQFELEDLYRSNDSPGWMCLRRDAGLPAPPAGPEEVVLARAIGRLLHVSDAERITTWRRWLQQPRSPAVSELQERDRRLLGMLVATLTESLPAGSSAGEVLERIWLHAAIVAELDEVLGCLDDRAHDLTMPIRLRHAPDAPLHVHGRYTRNEILAAFGHSILTQPREWREGVRYEESAQVDLLAITLKKVDRDFSPTTMYRDRAISRDLFHWESQSVLAPGMPTAERYIHHRERGSDVCLFARQTKSERAFTCLGTAQYVRHEGARPVAFLWRLDTPMPEAFFADARTEVA
jgi:superfamily II DNA or RNA helicase/HKD family nuclease